MNGNGDSPIFDPARRALGEQRLKEFIEHNAKVDFMKLALVMSVTTTIGVGTFTDDQLNAIKTDADDLLETAQEFVAWARHLAEAWRAQRIEAEA